MSPFVLNNIVPGFETFFKNLVKLFQMIFNKIHYLHRWQLCQFLVPMLSCPVTAFGTTSTCFDVTFVGGPSMFVLPSERVFRPGFVQA